MLKLCVENCPLAAHNVSSTIEKDKAAIHKVYVIGHPENTQLTPALAQHFQVVCVLFRKGQDWEYYYSQFRLLKKKRFWCNGEKTL